MARTGENIYKRADGRYEARYISGRDENGKAVYKSVYGFSKAEVREKVEGLKREIKGEPSPIDGKTFKQVAEEYLESVKGTIASTTYDRYLDALERDIYPEYEHTLMKDVTEAEAARYLKIAQDSASKRGRIMTKSSLIVVKAVLRNVIGFAKKSEGLENAVIHWDGASYEELNPQEIEMICLKAKNNHCPEMLATLLSLYCGVRTGELSALKSDDVDTTRNEIYIHETAHRVRNPKRGEPGEKKTIIVVEEMPWKNQIRRVKYPEILTDYINEFKLSGKTLIRGKDGEMVDSRTLENWLLRIMKVFRVDGINFERLRKTYIKGKADEKVLNHIFLGVRPDVPYAHHVDEKWLKEEMSKDLIVLRLLVGLSPEETADILGISAWTYRQLENGSKEASWDQYMSLLFLYHYNMRTTDIVADLGLYPEALKEKIRIGEE